MTKFPVISLASAGTEPLAISYFQSLQRSGIANTMLDLYVPKGFKRFDGPTYYYVEDLPPSSVSSHTKFNQPAQFGTPEFSEVTSYKWAVIDSALERYTDAPFITFTDIDILWLRNPFPILSRIMDSHTMAMQSECAAEYPQIICTGFMCFRQGVETRQSVQAIHAHHIASLQKGHYLNDQEVLNGLYQASAALKEQIYILPESLFPNGKLAAIVSPNTALSSFLIGSATPLIFHANWTLGMDSKRRLLDYAQGTLENLGDSLPYASKSGINGQFVRQELEAQAVSSEMAANDSKSATPPVFNALTSRIAVFESTPSTPHVETGLELAARFSWAGSHVQYIPLFTVLDRWESFFYYDAAAIEARRKKIWRNVQEVLSRIGVPHVSFKPHSAMFDFPTDCNETNIFELSFQSFPVGRYIASTLTFFLRRTDWSFKDPSVRHSAEVLFHLGCHSYMLSLDAIRTVRPDLVVLFNGRFVTSAGTKWACKKLGVEYLLHERGAKYDMFVLAEKSLHDFDLRRKSIFNNTPPETAVTIPLEAAAFFRDRMEGGSFNWRSFTDRQVRGSIPANLERGAYVAFFVSSTDELAFIGSDFDVGFGNQEEAFGVLKEVCNRLGLRLVVRMHPNLVNVSGPAVDFWLKLRDEGVIVILPDGETDTYELVKHARLVATFASTVGIEAAYQLKPVVVLGNALYYGASEVMKPRNYGELVASIQSPLSPTTRSGAEAYGYYQATFGQRYILFKPTPGELFDGTIVGVNVTR